LHLLLFEDMIDSEKKGKKPAKKNWSDKLKGLLLRRRRRREREREKMKEEKEGKRKKKKIKKKKKNKNKKTRNTCFATIPFSLGYCNGSSSHSSLGSSSL